MDHHGGKEERGWRKGEKTDDAFISLKKERARDSTNIQHLQGQKRYIWFNVWWMFLLSMPPQRAHGCIRRRYEGDGGREGRRGAESMLLQIDHRQLGLSISSKGREAL